MKMLQGLKFLCKIWMIIFSEICLSFYKGRLYKNVGGFLLTKSGVKDLNHWVYIFFLNFPLDQTDCI